MRTGNYCVMRYAALIGYSSGRKIVTLATRRKTLDDALDTAVDYARRYPSAAFWIAKVGARANFVAQDKRR